MSSFDDVLFSGIGKGITIRQMLVLGIGCGAVMLMVLRSGPSPDITFLPLIIIPIIFGIARTKTMTADEFLMSAMAYAVAGGSTKKIKAQRSASVAKQSPSMRLGLKQEQTKKVTKIETIRKIPVIDKLKPVRLNITILSADGTQYANKFVSVYMDDSRVAAVSTDGTGKLGVTVVPGKLGTRSLRVMPKDGDDPLLDGVVEFVDE